MNIGVNPNWLSTDVKERIHSPPIPIVIPETL